MMNYSEFNTTSNHSLNVYNALKYCKENNEKSLVFDKGIYHFYEDIASEDMMCVSNHDLYCFKKIAFLLKDMKNFTLDGGGSDFVFHDSIVPISVMHSEKITLKNLNIDCDEIMVLDIKIINVQDNYFDVSVINNDGYYISESKLFCCDKAGHFGVADTLCVRSMGNDKSFIPQSMDLYDLTDITFEDIGDKKIRIYNAPIKVEKDMHMIIKNSVRHSSGIVCISDKDVNVENVTIYKSYAMGLLAQKTENITIDKMTVKASDDSLYSLSADATHFVHCKGLVKVTNSAFSEQLDDALNIHGVYTKIIDKTDEYIVVKYMHHSAKGLDIYEKGSEFAVLNPETLISSGIYKISDVEVINMDYTKIYVDGLTEKINIGDVVEDLTWSCDLLFENNRVLNNRARGMLIAAKGKVIIRNNYFNTPGVAVLFESDGQFWYESGGTKDVIIEGNIFDNCKFTKDSCWGKCVIEVVPRKKFDGNNYFHRSIKIINNKFLDCNAPMAYFDNVENIIVEGNELKNSSSKIEYQNCGKVKSSL